MQATHRLAMIVRRQKPAPPACFTRSPSSRDGLLLGVDPTLFESADVAGQMVIVLMLILPHVSIGAVSPRIRGIGPLLPH